MDLKELLPYVITSFLEKGEIQNELDFQRGNIISKKLWLLSKKDLEVKKTSNALNELLYNYEQKHWSNSDLVTDVQIKKSEIAQQIAEKEGLH